MYLRKFEQKDAVYMLEWMHDKEVTKDLAADFEKKQLKDAEDCIRYRRIHGNCQLEKY